MLPEPDVGHNSVSRLRPAVLRVVCSWFVVSRGVSSCVSVVCCELWVVVFVVFRHVSTVSCVFVVFCCVFHIDSTVSCVFVVFRQVLFLLCFVTLLVSAKGNGR